MNRRRRAVCGTAPAPYRLSGTEAVTVIVIVVLAAVLALKGMPVTTVLELLGGAALVGFRVSRQAPASL